MLDSVSFLSKSEPSDAIFRNPIVVTPDTSAIAAIALMNDIDVAGLSSTAASQLVRLQIQARASCVAIVETGHYIGLLTAGDVVRLCARRQDLEELPIGEATVANSVTLRLADFTDLSIAIDLLQRHSLNHLPVVDDRDRLVGILTSELLQYRVAEALAAQLWQSETEKAELLENSTLDIQESAQFLQTVFDTFPLAVFWKDRSSRFLGCNQNFAHHANLNSPTEILGKNDFDLPWGETEATAYRADDRQVIDSGIAKLGIIEAQTQADGTSIWIETNKLPLRNLHGDTIGVLGTYQNITERKHTETELKRLSERLSLSLKSAAVGCWEWDIVNDSLIWDDRTYELYGIDRTVPTAAHIFTYSNWSACLHPEDRQAAEAKIGQVLFCETEFELEYRVIHPDGNIKFIKAYGLVQRDDRDRPYRAIGIHLDISAAKQNEAIRLQTERTIAQQVEREFVLREMTQRIRRSLDLPTIFETAVQEVRQFLATDRVGIFKFDTDFNFDRGEFVAEAVGDRFESILGAKIHDPGFGNKLAWFYQQDKINAVEDIHAAGLLDCEVRVLAQFQVRANLVIPLFNGPNLWGLLCLHHCAAPRTWQENEINFIKHIAEQIGIAIQQATLYEKVQLELEIRWRAEESIALKLRQQRTLGSIAQQIRNSLNIDDILATATAQVKDLMMVDRAIVCQISPLDRKLRAVAEVVAPTHTPLVELHFEREPLSNQEIEFYLLGQPRIVTDVAQDIWSMRWPEWARMAGAKSKIVAPILLRSNDSDTQYWLDPSDRVQLWGTISVHTCSMPRDWQDAEAQLLQQIADQLAIAIQQASLFEQLQRELTEKQQAETQLRQSNQQLAISNQELARATRLKDEFLANMSHELRTPLNAVLGMSEGLHDEIFGSINDRQRSAIATISKSGKQLLSLIENILDLSTMAANNFQLETTDVSVANMSHNSLLLVKEIALKKQIKLRLELPDYLKHTNIQVDDRRFRQVLHDLLSNAVKFTPPGGRITLDVRLIQITTPLPDERFKGTDPAFIPLLDRAFPPQQPATTAVPWQIAFSVVDTGIGIKPEHLSQLFQPFVQIDSSLNRQYAGTGLGLALVKRIAEMHAGNVCVQSQVDLGSCFTVSMPFCPAGEPLGLAEPLPQQKPLDARIVPPVLLPQSPPPVSDALPSNAIKQHPVILIAEDNPANMETMTGYLESRGYRPIEAENGVQAIELARSRQPDIILMDIQMPDLNGFEAIARLRQIPECANIPIIALTALASPPDRQKCLDAGADRYVTKPVKLSQLVATIDTLINSK
jgi:PAS domain S-box-containing protein